MQSILVNRFKLSPQEAEIYADEFKTIHYQRGDKFIAFGEVSHKVGFVRRGMLKCSMQGQAKEVVDDFIFEHQFAANYHSFLTQTPSTKDLICLEDSTIAVIGRHQLEALGEEHPFIARLARQMAETLFVSTHQKLEDLRLLSAEERYLKLLRTNGQLLDRIPQYEIASYLNVRPETVSRIRRNLTRLS